MYVYLFANNDAWRYGADSKGPKQVSSFAALDILVETLRSKLPNLEGLTVAGHSSGGQVVQRWSLLRSVWYDKAGNGMHAVVANPSSYAYLFPLRMVNDGKWSVPKGCCHYDEWGLLKGSDMEVPYRDEAL